VIVFRITLAILIIPLSRRDLDDLLRVAGAFDAGAESTIFYSSFLNRFFLTIDKNKIVKIDQKERVLPNSSLITSMRV